MICRPNNGSLNWRYPRVFPLLPTILRLPSHYPQEEPQQKRNQWIWYFIPGSSSPAPSAGNEAIVLPYSSSSPTGLGVPGNWIRHWTVGRRPGSVDNLIDSWEITGFASPHSVRGHAKDSLPTTGGGSPTPTNRVSWIGVSGRREHGGVTVQLAEWNRLLVSISTEFMRHQPQDTRDKPIDSQRIHGGCLSSKKSIPSPSTQNKNRTRNLHQTPLTFQS